MLASTEGVGTTVTLRLPLGDHEGREATASQEKGRGAGRTFSLDTR
jgi:hypothetical protein